MGIITIAVYRPKKGKEKQLKAIVKKHLPVLRSQDLITDRLPIVMRAGDKTIVEVFEWKSQKAIRDAHRNPEVLKLWDAFSAVCEYGIPSKVKEFSEMFPNFKPLN
jgi:hypothetical protein